MKVAIVSKSDVKKFKGILKKFGFNVVKKNPDIVLCYGGDGTVLYSERIFPGVPKIVVKKPLSVCRKCEYSIKELNYVLNSIARRDYKIVEKTKVLGIAKNKKLIGLNEVQLHNKIPTRAIRFSIKVNGKFFGEILGDGVIISTPFGSTAYYSSTGGRPFKKGIGISFNNPFNKKIKSIVVPENSKIEIKVIRGPAWFIADNYEKFVELKEGDKIVVKAAKEKAKFIDIKHKSN
ncbi:MAG: hypothetical protein QXX38_02150 [Candidatus Aenigmatarchaeota archaeon]